LISVETRFWSKVNEKSDDECWEWQGKFSKSGYGIFTLNGKEIKAHRFSYTLKNGPIPAHSPFICHKCGNRKCVNPNHLYAGTGKTNAKDRIDMGRQFHAYGTRNGNAKLPDERVNQIRRDAEINKRELGIYNYDGIAKKYHISKSHVGAIVRGERRVYAKERK
jgi:hypothetical protein